VTTILRTAVLAGLLACAAACGGGSGCAGYITINVTPDQCEAMAKEFGCPSFQVTGATTCGLSGCATCDGL
jgi:hypothetical protein